jgi:hypothetical protein
LTGWIKVSNIIFILGITMLEGVDIPEVNDDPSSLMVTVDSKMDNSSVLMKIANPKIKKRLIVSDLDLHNPEDKALSLCLKMLE